LIPGKDRRIAVTVHRTVKVGRPDGFDFTKYSLTEEVTVDENRDPVADRKELFTGLLKEAALYEAVVKTAGGDEAKIMQIIQLLARLLEQQGGQNEEIKEVGPSVRQHTG